MDSWVSLATTILSLFANIAQIVGFFWVLKYGSKTITQVLKPTIAGKIQPQKGLVRIIFFLVLFLVCSSVISLGANIFSVYAIINNTNTLPAAANTSFIKVTPHQDAPSTQQTLVTTSTPTQTPQLITAENVLCQADWTKDFNGWSGSKDWIHLRDMLVNNGGNSSIIAPCKLNTPNYAIEANIQFIRASNSGSFGIIGRGGYKLIAKQWDAYCNSADSVTLTVNDHKLSCKEYKLDISWHTYRLEMNEDNIIAYIDNQKVLETTDITNLGLGDVGLFTNGCEIYIKSFQVTAL